MIKLIKKIWYYLERKRKKEIVILLILMIFATVSEVMSVGAVLPFLAAIAEPSLIVNNEFINHYMPLNIKNSREIIFPFAVFFAFSIILACIFRLLLVWAINNFSNLVGVDIGGEVYRRSLYRPYQVHISRNSSEAISGITIKTDIIANYVLVPLITLTSSAFMLIGVLILLLCINLKITIFCFAIFSGIYYLIVMSNKFRLLENGETIARESILSQKYLNEGFGGIREILLNRTQEVYCEIYKKSNVLLRKAQSNTTFLSAIPRFFMEALGMLLITIGATYSILYLGIDSGIIISTFGILAIAAQRMLPLMQQVYISWTLIQGNKKSLDDILKLLAQELPTYNEFQINFENKIKLNNISFKYQGNPNYALKNINIEIRKGEKIGIVGKTGSGKSTLIDVIIGLLLPTEGVIEIDGFTLTHTNIHNWQSNISIVPQSIFLQDSTIMENIAFGVNIGNIDHDRVKAASILACINDDIDKLPNKYQELIGEKGVRLSGGQRQRIGIARALYKKANVIILDEATNALDIKTEENILNKILNISYDLTILLISHRIETLSNCDKIILFDGNNNCKMLSKKDYFNNNL